MDEKWFKTINSLAGHNAIVDYLMILISKKVRFLFIFVLIFIWFRNYSYKNVAIKTVISLLFALFINFLIKTVYFKPRPFMDRKVKLLIPSKKDSSFPSKHTVLAFAFSTSIFLYKQVIGVIMGILSILTGFSRIWVGHHYPSDIIGSAFIGTITSIVLHKSIYQK